MASDAGIYALSGKPTVALQDPNTVMRDAAATQGAVLQVQNALAGKARGELMQQAIDPDTGRYDPATFNRLAASDPRVAMALPEAMNQSQALQTSQTDLGMKQNDYINKVVPSLLKLPDDQIHGALADTVLGAQQMGIINPRDGARLLAQFPNDPAGMRMKLQQMQIATMPAGGQRDATFGTPAEQSDGQTLYSGVRSPVDSATPGAFNGSGARPLYPSRDALMAPRTVIGLDGRPVVQTAADQAADQGRPDLTGPAGARPGVLPPALVPKGYTGRFAPDGQGAAPAAPQPAAATPQAPVPGTAPAAAPAGPTGAVATGLAPGQQQEAEAAVDHLKVAREAANTYQNRMQPLMSAQAALNDAKTGAGTDTLNRVRQLVGTFTPETLSGVRSFIGLGTNSGDAAFDEARKYLTNYAANTPGANRSDAGASTAAHANASVEISPEAAKQVVKAAIGMERMKQAQVLEFQSDPSRTGAQYDRFQSEMATKSDPRAFMADQQTPAERAAMLGSMNATQKANYLASVRLAMKHQLLNLPTAAPAAAAPPAAASTAPVTTSRGY